MSEPPATRWRFSSPGRSSARSHISNFESSRSRGPVTRSLGLKTVKFSSSYIEPVLFPTEKMGRQKQGHIKSRFLIDPHLHRELRLPGPDRRSEVGPEEHPPVRRRSWQSDHIWTELRYKTVKNKKYMMFRFCQTWSFTFHLQLLEWLNLCWRSSLPPVWLSISQSIDWSSCYLKNLKDFFNEFLKGFMLDNIYTDTDISVKGRYIWPINTSTKLYTKHKLTFIIY